MKTHSLRCLGLVVSVVLAGCGIFDSDMAREVGALDLALVQASLNSLPDTLLLGAPVWVAATTIASPCNDPPEPETEVVIVGNIATVTPYDWQYIGGGDCPTVAVYYPHRVSVHFSEEGPARIVVRGRGASPTRDLLVRRPVSR